MSSDSTTQAPGTAASPATSARNDKVPVREKLAIGMGGLPIFLGLAAVGSFATPFYQMTLKMDPVWLAAALTVPRFLDAFIDPLVGRFSDNFHSRFGRRRPLIALGALIQALAFGLIWSQIALTAWLVLTQVVFYVGYSFFSVPFLALQYEVTPDYDERTSVSSYVGFFGKAGEMGYNYIFPVASSVMFASAISGVRTLGWVVGIVFLGLVALMPALLAKERFFHASAEQERNRRRYASSPASEPPSPAGPSRSS